MALQKNVSFKTRIVILFLAISLLTLIISSSILIYHDLKAFKESMKRNLSEEAKQASQSQHHCVGHEKGLYSSNEGLHSDYRGFILAIRVIF